MNFFDFLEHLELLERGELKSLYDSEQGTYEDEEDMDTNEDDTEGEEPEANEVVDDRLSESEEQHERTPAMNISKPRGLPEFKIEVSFPFRNSYRHEIEFRALK